MSNPKSHKVSKPRTRKNESNYQLQSSHVPNTGAVVSGVEGGNRKTIAVCMIVKNEEVMIERCLQSVSGADAIYVLDTGSQDKTIWIAQKYTENVFLDYVWDDDFSSAQNFLLDKVRGKYDWILCIDADEYLNVPFDEVRKAVEVGKDMVRVAMKSGGGNLNFGFGRLFRNDPNIFWVQPIHKHLNLPGEGEQVGNVEIVFDYSPAHQLDPDRTLRILERVCLGKPAIEWGRNGYYLGREYYYKGRLQEATAVLGQQVQVSSWDGEKADSFLIMSQCYSRQGMDSDAQDAILQALKINSNFKEACEWMGAVSSPENAKQWRRMAKTANNVGVMWDRSPAEPNRDIIFLAPHNDDESLFGAYTLMRHKPLVIIVTDSYIQHFRGDADCDALSRREETINAMQLVGCPVLFLGIQDTVLTEKILKDRLYGLNPEQIYVPAIQGGNEQHDLIGKVGMEMFGKKCERYTTYTKTELWTKGNYELSPTHTEMELKNKMLDCYKSQLQLSSTRPHFEAVRNKSEWLL